MSKKKQQLSTQELEIIKDKKYRLLKNLIYKYQISLKSLIQKPRQDNFIAYSIVKKISNTGWFSNQRLLVLDCPNKEIFYLTKVPDFIIDESSPIEIEKIKQSPLVKQRISLNSFAKQIKNVIRNENFLTIQWQNPTLQKSQQYQSNKKWVLEMTSSQLAKDWANLISIIEKGKLQNSQTVKKIAVVPQNIDELKKKTVNLISTPKSISDVPSIHMKSQILNFQGSRQTLNEKEEFMTPKNSNLIKQEGQNSKYFRKKKTDQTKNKVNDKLELEQQAKDCSQKLVFVPEQILQQPKHQKIFISEIANQFLSKPPQQGGQVIVQYLPLSQEVKEPFDLHFGKIRKNIGLSSNPNSSSQGKFLNLNLFKKYNLPSDSVIQQVSEDLQAGNILSQQLRNINYQQPNQPTKSKQQNYYPQSPTKQPGKLKKNIKISSEKDFSKESPIKKQIISSQKKTKQQQKVNFGKSPFQNKNSYWNTYNSIKQLPGLDSSYNWNEVYFNTLLEYYSLCCNKNYKQNENKLFDVLLKLEKHVEKFELYCSKGVRIFINHQILGFQQVTNSKTLSQFDKNSIINLRQEIFSIQSQSYHKGQEPINVFNDYYEELRKNSQIQNGEQLFKAYQQGVTQLIENEKKTQKKRQKIISFQFEGINFKLLIDQNQFLIYDLQKQEHFNFQSSLFYELFDKVRKRWSKLFNISYLNPYFTQRNKHKPQWVSYFHIFTPMIAVIQFHGLKFYCQAEFNPSLYNQYLGFDLNPISTSKQKAKHLNINKYLKNKLIKTSLSYFSKDKLIDQIEFLYLCKQIQKNNYFVIDKIKYFQQSQQKLKKQKDNSYATGKQKDNLYPTGKQKENLYGTKENFDLKRIFTFEQGFEKNTSQKIEEDKYFQQILRQNHKFLQIVACMQNQFSNCGGIKLTSHQTLKKLIKSLVALNILQQFQQIKRLYNLVRRQLQQNRGNLLNRENLHFLLNPNFIGYVIKLLHNEIVICLLISQVNLIMRDFLTNLHFAIKDFKSQSNSNDNQNLIDIYRTQTNQNNHQQKTQTPIVVIKQFAWSTQKNKTLTKNQVQIKNFKPLTNQQLSQMILHLIVNKALNQIFSIQKEKENQSHLSSDQKIKFKPQICQWIQVSTLNILEKLDIQTLDINYIYEGVLYELNIEKYFDPVSINKKSLQNQYRISQTPKSQLQKLIRDPYFSKNQKTQHGLVKKLMISEEEVIDKNRYKEQGWTEYISRLNDCGQSGPNFGYGISRVNSLMDSFPLSLVVKKLKIGSELQEIHSLIMQKDFNSAIEIYYLLINSNKKSTVIFYEYFKNAKKMKDNQSLFIHKNNSLPVSNNIKGNSHCSPTLLTYVLATQCVAYSFFQLLHSKSKNILQISKTKNHKSRKNTFVNSQTKKHKHSQAEKTQFHTLILKYNDMSHFGTQIIYGTNHIVYFINQVLFAFTKIMNKQLNQGKQYFQQCERIILEKADIFEQKYLILPVLYLKAHNDLILGFYRSAILSVRILMKCVFLFKQSQSNINEQNDKIQYWLQPYLINVLESHIPEVENDSLQNRLKSYNYLSFQILILCSENDPLSDVRKNRENLKNDIINELKSFNQIDKKYLKFLKLLWNIQTKLMVNDRKWLIKRTLMKLYDKLIREMNLKKQILNYDFKVLLNPLGTSKFSLGYLFGYSLFIQIFSKSDKYFNFLLYQFQNSQFHELSEYLHHKMSISSNKPSSTITLQHYDLKRQLFKDIILIIKFILILDQNFVFQTMRSQKHQKPHQIQHF